MGTQLLSLCLTGLLALSGCVVGEDLPVSTTPASLQQAVVAAAVYPEYPKYVNFQEYGDDWDRYQADNQAYRDQVAALEGEGISPTLGKSIGDFTAVTAERLLPQEGNQIYSPVNLYVALSVLSEITDGQTRQEVLSLLGMEGEMAQHSQGLWKNLYTNNGIAKTLLANSLWLRQDFPFQKTAVEKLAKDYYASTYKVVMGPEADKAMADWINQQTGGALAQQAAALKTDPQDAALVLLSTLYFYDQWSVPFQASATAPDTFTKADGSTVTCDFMKGSWTGRFVRNDQFQAAAKGFQDGSRMLFVLPNEGVDLAEVMQSKSWQGALGGEDLTSDWFGEIELSVPKFDANTFVDWKDHLKALGIEQAFDGKASDFTPLTKEPNMYLSKIQQASRVKIDEIGCTASSFVKMEIGAGSAMPKDKCVLKLDRPFLFVILSDSNIPLFVGSIQSPG